ncbi:MAG: hypothetical protein DRP58_07495, partial [Spirochaetes bacterium]
MSQNEQRHKNIGLNFKCKQFIGNSQPIMALKEMICRVAPSEETILIQGESGTGKEIIA